MNRLAMTPDCMTEVRCEKGLMSGTPIIPEFSFLRSPNHSFQRKSISVTSIFVLSDNRARSVNGKAFDDLLVRPADSIAPPLEERANVSIRDFAP